MSDAGQRFDRNREGYPAVYLGDGAYAAFDGYAVHVYADNGLHVTDRVVLELDAIAALMRFARTIAAGNADGGNEP